MSINYIVDIDENNVVRIYDGINPEPFIYQPHQPNGEQFTAETAATWAEQFIEEHQKPAPRIELLPTDL